MAGAKDRKAHPARSTSPSTRRGPNRRRQEGRRHRFGLSVPASPAPGRPRRPSAWPAQGRPDGETNRAPAPGGRDRARPQLARQHLGAGPGKAGPARTPRWPRRRRRRPAASGSAIPTRPASPPGGQRGPRHAGRQGASADERLCRPAARPCCPPCRPGPEGREAASGPPRPSPAASRATSTTSSSIPGAQGPGVLHPRLSRGAVHPGVGGFERTDPVRWTSM